jgi:hypothetical protein
VPLRGIPPILELRHQTFQAQQAVRTDLALLARSGGWSPFDLAQCTLWSCAERGDMKPPDKRRLGEDEPPLQLSRSDEALRIIEEYANHLREIIKKLRQRLH